MHGEHRVAFGGEVDVAQLRAALRIQRAVRDGIPKVAAGGWNTLYFLFGVHADSAFAIGHEDPLHPRHVLHFLQTVRHQVTMEAEFVLRDRAVAQVDSGILWNECSDLETLASELSDLCSRLREPFSKAIFLSSKPLGFHRADFALAALHACKDRPQAVILLLRNGIEFVIMTTRTIDRNTHGRCDDLRDHVIQIACASCALEHVALCLHLPDKIPRPRRQKAGGDDRFLIIGTNHVARNLLVQKLVVRLIRIQRLDNVVAITPSIRAQLVALKSMRVGIVRDVQPMPRPALAVVR